LLGRFFGDDRQPWIARQCHAEPNDTARTLDVKTVRRRQRDPEMASLRRSPSTYKVTAAGDYTNLPTEDFVVVPHLAIF